MPASARSAATARPSGLPGRTPAQAFGAVAHSAGALGAGQSGDALGGRYRHGPYAGRLRGVYPTAATDRGEGASELPAADLAGETGGPGAAGRQPCAGA